MTLFTLLSAGCQGEKFVEKYGGSVLSVAVLPVRYPAAAYNTVTAGSEVKNLVFPLGDTAGWGAAGDLLGSEYSGQCDAITSLPCTH